ncbi:hypothetical protein [Nitrospirillum iridis]|uniref:FCP1 homology domain-containing protein n=1 Tax=Nitrospirillum iridis TaxID=765888 RepID=A0A7X0AZE3_9PROT|nr:hypothetical protein [Nitrospirillum iridis]MBB6252952.1 hypothetical protein [Nitrospirillum iridis]
MLELSPLPKTWLVDIDGTLFRHNGHLTGTDIPLPGAASFMQAIPATDRIVLMTARSSAHEAATRAALLAAGIRFDLILFDLPAGERILINDAKPSGLQTAHAVTIPRDGGLPAFADMARIVDK